VPDGCKSESFTVEFQLSAFSFQVSSFRFKV
jgi:hypothetical protein